MFSRQCSRLQLQPPGLGGIVEIEAGAGPGAVAAHDSGVTTCHAIAGLATMLHGVRGGFGRAALPETADPLKPSR